MSEPRPGYMHATRWNFCIQTSSNGTVRKECAAPARAREKIASAIFGLLFIRMRMPHSVRLLFLAATKTLITRGKLFYFHSIRLSAPFSLCVCVWISTDQLQISASAVHLQFDQLYAKLDCGTPKSPLGRLEWTLQYHHCR